MTNIRIETILKFMTYVIAGIGFISVVRYASLSYISAFLIITALALFRDFSHPFVIPRWTVNTTALMVLVIAFPRIDMSNLVLPAIDALLVLMALKLLESKHPRDYFQIYALTIFILAGSSLLSLDMVFLAYLVAMIFSLGAAVVLLTYMSEEPDLALDLKSIGNIIGKTSMIPLLVLPATVLLFVILPRTNLPLFDFFIRAPKGVSGFTDEVQIGSVSFIQENEAVIFRAHGPKIPDAFLYWRGIVLDKFNGRTWRNSSKLPVGRMPFPGKGQIVRYTIFLEPSEQPYLFTLDKPINLIYQKFNQYDDLTYTLPNIGVRRIRYDQLSALSKTIPMTNVNKVFYLQLPEKMERIQKLTQSLTEAKQGPEKAQVIMDFFQKGGFRYSLKNLPITLHPVEEFIFKYRYGNCEYFASAMAVMLRTIGIPARIVGGYRGGFYHEMGGYYIVPQKNAHVWVEAWFDGPGWVRFDPTPASLDTITGFWRRGLLLQMRLALDILQCCWNASVINFDLQKQFSLFIEVESLFRKPLTVRWPEIRTNLTKIAYGLAGIFLTSISLILIIRWPAPEKRIMKAFQKKMVQRGYNRNPSEGLEEFVSRMKEESLKSKAMQFAGIFEKGFYRDEKITRRDVAVLRRLLKDM